METGKKRHWTQENLAVLLGVKKLEIHRMEKNNQGLDSIERRKTLAELLKIPPALFGLTSFPSTAEILASLGQVPTSTKHTFVPEEEISLYQDALALYTRLFSDGTITDSLPAIEKWISRIQSTLEYAASPQKLVLYRLLWTFHKIAALTYAYDLYHWVKAFEHLDEAKTLAETLDDTDLQAASLYYAGDFRFLQGKPVLARKELDIALQINGVTLQTKGAVHAYAALAHAMTDTDLATSTRVQRLLDKAEQCAYAGDEPGSLRYRTRTYLRDRADTLISLGRYGKALEFLDNAEEVYENSQQRTLTYLNILRSECYIKQNKPEYEEALRLLEQVLTESQSQYHIQYAGRLYQLLIVSPCGTLPKVAELGLRLRELKKR